MPRSLILLSWLLLAGCVTVQPNFPYYPGKYIDNANIVLRAFEPRADHVAAENLIGSRVAFIGSCPRPSESHDLDMYADVTLHVVFTSQPTGQPPPDECTAEAFGRLKAIDFEKRIVTVVCKPADWRFLRAKSEASGPPSA